MSHYIARPHSCQEAGASKSGGSEYSVGKGGGNMVQFLGYVDQNHQVSYCPPQGLTQILTAALAAEQLLAVAAVSPEKEETTLEK